MSDTCPLFTGEPDDPLPGLARRIQDAHQRCEESIRKSVALAAEVGRLLGEAKGRVKHGEWVAWVRTNCTFGVRMAQNYMRVAVEMPELKAKRVAYLPLREALAFLAEPETDERERRAIAGDLGGGKNDLLDMVRLMEKNGRVTHLIKTAGDVGWATDGDFLDRLSPTEQAAFAQLPHGQEERKALNVQDVLPAADARLSPVKTIGRAFNPKDRLGWADKIPTLVVLETEEGEVVPVEAGKFRLLRRRHEDAEISYIPEREVVVFRRAGEALAVLKVEKLWNHLWSLPGCDAHGREDPAEAVRKLLAAATEQIRRMEEEVAGLGRIAAMQTAMRLAKVVDELDRLCPQATSAKQEQPAVLQEATAD